MPTRILPAVGDVDAVRSITTLLSQLPDAEPVAPVADSTQLVDTLARLAAESVDELPEVVVVHERIGPVPALELIREVALRFPAVGGILVTVSGAKGGVGATLTAIQLALAAQASGRSTALVDMDLQTGDVASYLDVQFRRSVVDLAAITDISPRVLAD